MGAPGKDPLFPPTLMGLMIVMLIDHSEFYVLARCAVIWVAEHGLRSNLRVPNFQNFSWGSMLPDPPSLFTLKHNTMAIPV